jgi:hypothetical protein
MRKVFEDKFMRVHETADDVRDTVRKVGDAAQAQATLSIALTGACVVALLVAVYALATVRTGAPRV